MKRRYGSSRFHSEIQQEENINPMDGLGNLADVMLVFACGLMLALITFWNLDVLGTSDSIEQPPVEIAQDNSENAEQASEEALQEYGTVYIDPETGKLYIKAGD